ncbi:MULTISPECIES: cytochrome P450 [Pseudonocardia]|uniref:Cytochrome P450 107B1 n=2 Tax=Pseudonocardia TaxID=1847 RepID=A0A1Y2MVL9_PSEAH|nr:MULTISPECIES: cytochrome P450 [Pseudonocardia]OSY38857.1 Cytochrome P450 107B1 [Pseudonocardia autotrophica]TDN76113.1 cytochrome P450 [Pseudonocardia autotrophica]BBG00094.1 cytochrome P450 [Pseudonocardia autotrophica]GEC26059.1 cytochrome P450 [Pseudonocardia saturnea]
MTNAVDFDPYSAHLSEPGVWDAYAAARAAGPAAWSGRRGGFWVLTRFDDVRAALRDPQTFSSGSGHRIPTDGSQRAIPIDFDPPLHTAYRRLMTAALSPARVRELKPFLERTVADLVDRFVAAGGGEFVREVALPLPLLVLTELIGFDPATVAQFRAVTEQMWSGLADDDEEVDFAGARARVDELMRTEIAAHRADGRTGFVTDLLDAEIDGRPLDEDEIISILVTFAVAGHETTMNSASTLVHLLVTEPGQQDRLRADPGLAPRFVEEMLRHRSPAQNFARRATCPAGVGGQDIATGDAVLLSFAAANRDPERFADPDRFDPDRDTRGHLGFGWGIHQCMGAALARSELAILLTRLCAHPPVAADGEVRWSGLQGGNHLGPTTLPVRFGPARTEKG